MLRKLLAGRSGKKILALLLPLVFTLAPLFLGGNPAILAILRAVQPYVLPSTEPAPVDPGQPEKPGGGSVVLPGGFRIDWGDANV